MIRIEIETENAAFGERVGDELSRILHELADRVNGYHFAFLSTTLNIKDIDNNPVGKLEVIE